MTTRKGGRTATGTVDWRPNPKREGKLQWMVRLTLPGNKRSPWIELPESIPESDRPQAEASARQVSDEARANGAIPDATKETVSEYAKRWCKAREVKGLACVGADRTLLRRHVLPVLGSRDVRAVGRDDMKELVAELDAKVQRGRDDDGKSFGWKTAVNAWGTVKAMFRDAVASKRVDLCVRRDNPTEDVAGPDTGPKKAKAYLWPSEFLALVSCAKVPVRWRRLFALAVYTYARAGELAALTWEDVDLEHGILHIHRSIDRVRKRKAKATKGDAARRIPIEPALVPLLQSMHIDAKGRGAVFGMPSVGVLSKKLKTYLRRAGVERADLFTSDATRKAITFHDLRATGITWMAVRGDDPLKIMTRAGHADFETTKIYLREAENLGRAFGEVFPPVPVEVVIRGGSSVTGSDIDETSEDNNAELLRKTVELTGIEADAGNAPIAENPAVDRAGADRGVSERSRVSEPLNEAPPKQPKDSDLGSNPFDTRVSELEARIVAAELAGRTLVADLLTKELERLRAVERDGDRCGQVVQFRKRA